MSIIIKPIISEKATDLSEKLNRYSFIVNKKSNKIEIKEAVERFYGVNVERVNTMVCIGTSKSRFTKKGGTITGNTGSVKKAIVTLRKGDSIDLYANV